MIRRALVAILLAVVVLATSAPTVAYAQSPSMSTSVSARQVEVGEQLQYSLRVIATGDEEPSDPQPGVHPGFTVVQTSSVPFRMDMRMNGQRTSSLTLNTTWVLRADKPGTFTLGPASVALGGTRKKADAVRVTVVPRGTQPSQQRQQDPFTGIPGLQGIFQFGDDRESNALDTVTSDPRLALEAQRDRAVFLHATVDKTRALVGEQVTLSVLRYDDPQFRNVFSKNQHEPSAPDFLRHPLMSEPDGVNLGLGLVGGRPWSVKLIYKAALFPLKAGRLTISPMSFTVPEARVSTRESETLTVDVTEPPVAGRPPGYQLGDVGDYSLSATVSPRTITQGGAVGITVELRGTGNLPAKLSTPIVPGIEWLPAQTADNFGPMQDARLGGSRTFSYVVRMNRAGDIDLGEIRLPFFDPGTRSYSVARAALGIVNVTPGPMVDAGADPVETILSDLPKERRALEGAHAASFVADRAYFWALLFVSPFATALAIGARGAARALRERRRHAKPSNAEIARERRSKAQAALRGTDPATVVSATAKALEADVLARTGVNVRGTGADEAVRELKDAGVSDLAAREIMATLRACEDARFSPDGISLERAKELASRATKALEGIDGDGTEPS